MKTRFTFLFLIFSRTFYIISNNWWNQQDVCFDVMSPIQLIWKCPSNYKNMEIAESKFTLEPPMGIFQMEPKSAPFKIQFESPLPLFVKAMAHFYHWTVQIRILLSEVAIKSSKCNCIKGCRMGRSDEVSLWYVPLLINTRFRFFILE